MAVWYYVRHHAYQRLHLHGGEDRDHQRQSALCVPVPDRYPDPASLGGAQSVKHYFPGLLHAH
jgi:hypothetical protein